MLRLLFCDYQRTARYYTIYRTFKSQSSDDFTTIPRLFYRRNYDYWLRLFQKLLRLFQPERYDYCSSLLAIGQKPEKRCGASRQWFRAARRSPATGLPRRVEGARSQAAGRGKHRDPAGLAWSAIYYTIWHGSIAGRVYVLQRVAGGIIAACAGMVSAAIEWGKLQETPLQSPVRCFAAWAV